MKLIGCNFRSLLIELKANQMPRKPNWGGRRAGAGRPRRKVERCACGVMPLSRAKTRGHKCEAFVLPVPAFSLVPPGSIN